MAARVIAAWLLFTAGFACGGKDGGGGSDDGEDGGPTDSGPDADSDTDTDTGTDTGTGEPSQCADPSEIPEPSEAGLPCFEETDCELGFRCLDAVNGWWEGYCYAGGAEDSTGCDPEAPVESCPRGSSCVYVGTNYAGDRFFYCMRDCVISAANPWDDSSCGCRPGYQCDYSIEVCIPGCRPEKSDEDCCTYWADLDGDWVDDGDKEDLPVPSCNVVCDPESYRCVHPGDSGSEWGGPCTLDQECPENGYCLRERDADGFEGGTRLFPQGYCIRHGCDLAGRECDGSCREIPRISSFRRVPNQATSACVDACNVVPDGADPFVHNPECREGYGCHPLLSAQSEDLDGYCWTGELLTADTENNAGGSCTYDYDCFSPFGQGSCIEASGSEWTDGVCVIQGCDFSGMETYCSELDDKICEPMGEGELSLCLERCDDPGGGSGPTHGCSRDDYACYPSANEDGSGVCLPSCRFDSFCRNFFPDLDDCNTSTGICQ